MNLGSKDRNKSIHRLIAIQFIENLESKTDVDHINRIKNDNRLDNLRWATVSENSVNKKIQSNNSSGITGVTWIKERMIWKSKIQVNYEEIHLGYFTDINDAINARKKAEENYFGEFSRK